MNKRGSWYAGDCDDELGDTAYAAGTPTDDPELLEQFDGNLEDADAIFLLLALVLLMA